MSRLKSTRGDLPAGWAEARVGPTPKSRRARLNGPNALRITDRPLRPTSAASGSTPIVDKSAREHKRTSQVRSSAFRRFLRKPPEGGTTNLNYEPELS